MFKVSGIVIKSRMLTMGGKKWKGKFIKGNIFGNKKIVSGEII